MALIHLVRLGNMSIISRKIDGITVGQKRKDGYVNATALADAHYKATGVRRDVNHWLDVKRTQESIEHLSLKTGIPGFKLVEAKKGRYGGTWIHPRLSVRFAMWLSDDFGYLVEEWIEQWLTTETKRKAEQSPWGKVREEGKETRREFTDAIQDYIERHPELPDDAKTLMYANASDKVNLVVFGRTAKQLLRDFQVSERTALRDAFTSAELQLIREVENVAMRLVDSRDIHPFRAVAEAEVRLVIPVSSRALVLN